MFQRILIANRGEIAVRIIKTCKKLGIETVVIYSEADRDSIPVKLADRSICIGPANPQRSYLYIPAIISAAEISDVDAIHPGYGFLSENSHFAEVCRSCHIEFIGPGVESMEMMHNKSQAKEVAKKASVPTIPGSEGVVKDTQEALKIARDIGYPIMLKAAEGGGGRGMKIVHNDAALINAFNTAQAEAKASFGSADLYIEKFIPRARHIEVQILADKHGNILHLGERECTIQRRHQKLIEESPSPIVDDALRKEIGEAAIRIAKQCNYTNAGTVEFIMDENKNFYFMEMNMRVQVEHPVTEMITGIDIVEQQIRIAAGEKLSFSQEDISFSGSAIEVRINAEDPNRDFAPSPGRIMSFIPPTREGVRVDTHAFPGYTISPYYDSLIAKLIVKDKDRSCAIKKMLLALDEFIIEGPITTIGLYKQIFRDMRFINGDFDTGFIEEYFKRRKEK